MLNRYFNIISYVTCNIPFISPLSILGGTSFINVIHVVYPGISTRGDVASDGGCMPHAHTAAVRSQHQKARHN